MLHLLTIAVKNMLFLYTRFADHRRRLSLWPWLKKRIDRGITLSYGHFALPS